MLKATSFVRAGKVPKGKVPFDLAVLAHDERHLRRKLLTLVHGDEVLVDLPSAVRLESGDWLVLEDGRFVDIQAAEEKLYEVRGRDPVHLMQLCWHIGNRHLPAQILPEWEGLGLRIVIQRDHVIKAMLEGLGATVTEISEPFSPEPGAYSHGDHSHALLNR
jgi:urease accessory protein